MRAFARRLAGCLVVGVISLGGLGSPAAAEGLDIGLPEAVSITERTEIPFAISSPEPICSVRSSGAGRVSGTGPYVLTIDPTGLDPDQLVQDVRVYVETCDGLSVYESVQVTVPFVVRGTQVVAPWSQIASERDLFIEVSAPDDAPVSVAVLRNGRVVKDFGPIAGRRDLRWSIPASKASGTWQIRSTGVGTQLLQDVTVAGRWALLLGERQPMARFPACSTVTWAYDRKGAPARVRGIEADIAEALRRMARLTGLTFERVGDGADLAFNWADLARSGQDGIGGGQVSFRDGVTNYRGSVTLNRRGTWVQFAGFGRAARWGGVPARGHLLLHEIGHALGLGHVTDPNQLMYPTASRSSPTGPARGDVAGLRWLYRPQDCPAG
jgi:hypothetical protein